MDSTGHKSTAGITTATTTPTPADELGAALSNMRRVAEHLRRLGSSDNPLLADVAFDRLREAASLAQKLERLQGLVILNVAAVPTARAATDDVASPATTRPVSKLIAAVAVVDDVLAARYGAGVDREQLEALCGSDVEQIDGLLNDWESRCGVDVIDLRASIPWLEENAVPRVSPAAERGPGFL